MADPDLSQLRALIAVIDAGSFDAAATALHLTPSAVSQRIKALEQSAGQVLVRRTKPTEATAAGHAYLRLARQVAVLADDVRVEVGSGTRRPATIPLAVNGDSLATWVLPALAGLSDVAYFDIRREDEGRTVDLLRAGTVMAAITSDSAPVQGCRSTRLGIMRYRPVASPGFAAQWFPQGVDSAGLAQAPVVVFDRNDDLQDAYLRRRCHRRVDPPRQHVPASSQFAEAICLGLGWGMLPEHQSLALLGAGRLVDLDPGQHVDVTLHWQQWALETPALQATALAIREAADRHLMQVPARARPAGIEPAT